MSGPLWVVIGPLLALYILTVVLFALYLLRGVGTQEMDHEKYINLNIPFKRYLVEFILWVFDPFERFCRRVGITPNMLTLGGSALAFGAAYAYLQGRFGAAGWLLAFGGILDTLDGHLARRLGKETRGGAFLDSTMDRWTEGVVFIGIAGYYRASGWFYPALFSFLGSMLVSYTKARGEGLGLNFKGGFFKRSERIFYLWAVSVLTPLADLLIPRWPVLEPEYLFKAGLVLFALGTNLTALYRTYNILKKLDSPGAS